MIRLSVCISLILILAGCSNKPTAEQDHVALTETKTGKDNKSKEGIWIHPELLKSAYLPDSAYAAFGHSYPVEIYKDTAGKVWVHGWEDLIDFKIDPDCGDKFFEYNVPLDTALRNMTGSLSGFYRYFSMNDYFKKSGKKFIINEVNHRQAKPGVVYEHNDVNLYFAGNRKDLNIILTQASITDAFDKELEITSILYNLTDKPIAEYNGTITITETTGLKDTTIVQKVTLGPVNLLTDEIPPYSVQMVKKKIPNKVKARETKFRYFTDNFNPISYRYSGDSTHHKLNN